MKRRVRGVVLCIALSLSLDACGSSPLVRTYRNDTPTYLKTLVYCENHYPALKDTPECRAALQINQEMFPGYHP